MEEQIGGGCACGKVRYTATVRDQEAYLCHCRMCQRASGNVSLALKSIKKASVRWERTPDYYASSPIASRGYCATCGSSLTFEFPDSEDMDLTVASFDDPYPFKPTHNFGIESMHEAWLDVKDLSGTRADENPSTVSRWMKVCGKLPD